MIFPIMQNGQSMLQKDLALPGIGIKTESFKDMLQAGTGIIMLLLYADMAGIVVGDDFSVIGELKQPRKEVDKLKEVECTRLRTELNS